MRRRITRFVAALVLVCAGASATLAASASAQIAWHACANSADFACATLAVPLDPGGVTPGTIKLSLERRRAPLGNGSVAVIALAGGPGQAAIPFAADTLQLLAPAVLSRDLIVFDQRGTGTSDPLHCQALNQPTFADNPPASAVAACARELGPDRQFFTTADSVADIEAIRKAAGYSKLVLYGTSYGTKVALDYALAYPHNVQRLVLDSTVTPDGPDVYSRSTFAAIPHMLSQLCAGTYCSQITTHPNADLDALVARLRRAPLHGRVFSGHGVPQTVTITEDDILDILVSGDLDPTLRADFPAAVRSALNGDNGPLARLDERALGPSSGEGGIDNALFYATTCQEGYYPWNPAATPAQRLAEATAATRALGAAVFAPFSAKAAIDFSAIPQCYAWPYTTPAPASPSGTLPNVPTLIISGAADLRTPTADARQIAAEIPDAHLVVVPHTGHSVLGSDFGTCSSDAVKAFFANRAIPPCRGESLVPLLRPTPLAPARLSEVPAAPGLSGRLGQTVTAFELTLKDLERQLAYDSLNGGSTRTQVSVGGLRGGWATLKANGADLHRYSYVPGVTVSGDIASSGGKLYLAGKAALSGVFVSSSHGAFVASVDGLSVDVPAAALNPY